MKDFKTRNNYILKNNVYVNLPNYLIYNDHQ